MLASDNISPSDVVSSEKIGMLILAALSVKLTPLAWGYVQRYRFLRAKAATAFSAS